MMTDRSSRTQYYTAATLDGYIAGPDHSLDWLFQFGAQMTPDYPEFIAAIGAVAMGSSTYEWILRHLAGQKGAAQAWPYQQPAWVFSSRRLPAVPCGDIRFVRGDVRPVHQAMREAAGTKNIWLVGGGELVGQFHDHGLLDDLIMTLAPVTLGAGMPLLPRKITTPPFKLTGTAVYGPFVQLRYSVER